MAFEMKDVLGAVGPNAGLVFASWIFMQFLQTRYGNAYERYRTLINDIRDDKVDGKRRQNIHDEVILYRRRINRMSKATNLGLYAAMLLLVTMISGPLDVVLGSPPFLKYVAAACSIAGLALIIWSATLVVSENKLIDMPLDRETDDLPEFARGENTVRT
jgi:hypothetical protein